MANANQTRMMRIPIGPDSLIEDADPSVKHRSQIAGKANVHGFALAQLQTMAIRNR
jgi:hypothetical protein